MLSDTLYVTKLIYICVNEEFVKITNLDGYIYASSFYASCISQFQAWPSPRATPGIHTF